MSVITALSQANADYLRALQLRSGSDILLLKDDLTPVGQAALNEAETALAACQVRIDTLEQDLARIDLDIQATENREI
ncbi:hypothetical protein [Puniceibacterium confluentis]|nr:hypothetical protein [Puniceibacterium confluentis]